MRSQLCDACVLLAGELSDALEETKAEFERSKEYNDKKAQKVDKVQKAQTRRWLKNEYKVELAASVEERLENACDDKKLFETVCVNGARAGAWENLGATRSKDKEACEKLAKGRCIELRDEYAEPLVRATLDGKAQVAACAKLLENCEPSAAVLAEMGEVAAPADKVKDEV